MKVLIIIPTYNERSNIELLLPKIVEYGPGADILVVDDDSPDGTVEEVHRVAETISAKVAVIVREPPRGLGRAYTAGLLYGIERGYDVLLTMDADLSHDPSYIPQILKGANDADVVVGSRYIRDGGVINWPLRRILLSWSANKFARAILHLPGADLTSGYRAYRTSILRTIDFGRIHSEGYSYLVEMLYRVHRVGGLITEVPIIFYDRRLGSSKISKREIYVGAINLLRLGLSGKVQR